MAKQRLNWERVVRRTMHPTRVLILETLQVDGELSPSEVAARHDGMTIAAVSHHFHSLEKSGLIKEARTVPKRGTIEHRFVLT